MAKFKLMKKETKVFLVAFLVSGGVFAVLTAVWAVAEDEAFSIGKFLFHFIFFGLFMGVFSVYNHRKSLKRDLNEEGDEKNELK